MPSDSKPRLLQQLVWKGSTWSILCRGEWQHCWVTWVTCHQLTLQTNFKAIIVFDSVSCCCLLLTWKHFSSSSIYFPDTGTGNRLRETQSSRKSFGSQKKTAASIHKLPQSQWYYSNSGTNFSLVFLCFHFHWCPMSTLENKVTLPLVFKTNTKPFMQIYCQYKIGVICAFSSKNSFLIMKSLEPLQFCTLDTNWKKFRGRPVSSSFHPFLISIFCVCAFTFCYAFSLILFVAYQKNLKWSNKVFL